MGTDPPPLAIQTIVEFGRRPIEVADNEAGIGPLCAELKARGDAPLLTPTVGGVAEFTDPALLGLGGRVLHVVRKHAQQDVRAHPAGRAMVDRAYLEIHRLQRAERALHVGHLVLVDHLAHAQADRVGPLKLARIDAGLDRLQALLGGRQQRLALTKEVKRRHPSFSRRKYDPGYQAISQDLREKLDILLAELEKVRANEELVAAAS